MRAEIKRISAYAAIIAIALQALFAGLSAQGLAAFDPTAVICHSDGTGPQAPQPVTADDCCAHCILCGATAMASPPAAPSLAELPRARGERLTVLPAVAAQPGAHASSHFARGPPQSV